MDKDLTTTGKGLVQTEDSEYVRLVLKRQKAIT